MATKGETLEVWGEINQGTNIHVILYIYIYTYLHTVYKIDNQQGSTV